MSEGSDISFISDSDDECTARKPETATASAAPVGDSKLWEEVDTDELERVALAVARNAIPPDADAAEAALARRAQEPQLDLDSRDPLGLTPLDLRTLTLVKMPVLLHLVDWPPLHQNTHLR